MGRSIQVRRGMVEGVEAGGVAGPGGAPGCGETGTGISRRARVARTSSLMISSRRCLAERDDAGHRNCHDPRDRLLEHVSHRSVPGSSPARLVWSIDLVSEYTSPRAFSEVRPNFSTNARKAWCTLTSTPPWCATPSAT